MTTLKQTAIATGIALAVAGTGVAQAQSESAGPRFSKQELKSFAVALLTVRDLNREMLDKVARAQTPEEETIVRSEAQQDMVKAVQEKGLSVSQYNRISMEVRSNPEVAERVQRYIERAR